jgi:hypothetical protein
MKLSGMEQARGPVSFAQGGSTCVTEPTKNPEPVASSIFAGGADRGGRWIEWSLWVGAAVSVLCMAIFLPAGNDAKDYLVALRGNSSLAYSPLFMIPTVAVARLLPLWLTVALFGLAYFSGWLTQLWVGMQYATLDERRVLRYVVPNLVFFPGLLVSDAITAGNLAYILYGLMLAALAYGVKRERWNWFYLAVLAAACVKVHLLTMLAIPLLCGRRQWMRTVLTGSVGVSLYALQARIWPQAFDVYVNSLNLLSHSRHDFGCGPVGNLARILQLFGLPHEIPCMLFYGVYATVLFLLLLRLSRLYREQRISLESWAPVMLIGVILLNPRIQSYDVAAVSVPMALIVWRALHDSEGSIRKPMLIGAAALLIAFNVFVEINEDVFPILTDAWKYAEMFLLLGVFASGVGLLLKEAKLVPFDSPSYGMEGVPQAEMFTLDA